VTAVTAVTPVTLPTIALTLSHTHPRKAAGDDGISPAFLKAAKYIDPEVAVAGSRNGMIRALTAICNSMFQSAVIPRIWQSAIIVLIEKRGGDSTNPADKRGISLINTTLKTLCKVVQRRLERHVHRHNLLGHEQAGFK
jgi:hypothetical protein